MLKFKFKVQLARGGDPPMVIGEVVHNHGEFSFRPLRIEGLWDLFQMAELYGL